MKMIYDVTFTKDALRHIKKIEKSEFNRVVRFISELELHPRTGTGKPEQMKHQREGTEAWSRRVNKNERFIYHISEVDKQILVIQAMWVITMINKFSSMLRKGIGLFNPSWDVAPNPEVFLAFLKQSKYSCFFI